MRFGFAGLIGALLAGCFTSEGGVVQRMETGPRNDAGLCSSAVPCPFGYLCGPTGACIPCTGGPGCLPPEDRDAFVPTPPDAEFDGAVPTDMSPPAPDVDMTPLADMAPTRPDAVVPPEPDACIADDELCNDLDDDCDGLTDEGFDLSSDPAHCGGCNEACPALPNIEVQCLSRQCLVIGCQPGWRDQNGRPDDGCEFPVVELVLGPDDHGHTVRDAFQLTIEVEGIQHVDRLTVSVANDRLASIEAADTVVVDLDLSDRFEGETLLTVRALAEDGTLLATETLFVIIDRSPPLLRIVTPGPRTPIDDAPFAVTLEITDLTNVTSEIYVDGELTAELDGRPYETTVDPTDFPSGVHRIRAEATDAAGNSASAEVEVSFIFCADAEMVPIPNRDVLIDPYESSRPDASAETEGENESIACSRRGVLPWRLANYAQAEQACLSSGKRLCTQEEWELACGGAAHRAYPYGGGGPNFRACNAASHPGPETMVTTGDLRDCVTPEGVFDLSGNLAEWVAGRFGTGLSGGHYSSGDFDVRCDSHLGQQGQAIRPQHGFRCCLDL